MLKEITMFEFNNFCSNHPYSNFYQTSSFAILSTEENFTYDYLGYFEDNILIGATLVLIKKIGLKKKYGYAPRGFILEYQNYQLLQKFTTAIIKFYKHKLIFIKIDPLIIYKIYDYKYNQIFCIHPQITHKIESLGYKKLKDNLYFESQLPRFNAVIDLKNFNILNIAKNTRNKINKALNKGLSLVNVSNDKLNIVYKLLNNPQSKDFKYYNNFYRVFSQNDKIDLLLVKVDYEIFMENAKKLYDKELLNNEKIKQLLKINNSEKNVNKKITSDKLLVTYKNAIIEASNRYKDGNLEEFVAAAIIIKHNKTINILDSGYDRKYKDLCANYFLHYALIEHYKDNYDYLYISSLTGDFSKESKYYTLNKFILGFAPYIYEYIGELDLIIDKKTYENMLISGKLHQIFD